MSQNTKNLFGFTFTALCLILLASSFMFINSSIHAADDFENFDHFSTGFPLTGKHEFLDCSSCHIGGQYRGTPLECVLCHNNSRAPGKNSGHIPSSNRCDDCHSDQTWKGARFDHLQVTGLCLSCHNGSTATGKSTTHFVTTLDCDRCHATTRWTPLILFRHDSPDYPGDHRTTVLCVDCHRTNNQVIAWPFPAYQPECAACHAFEYVAGEHGNLPVSDVADCSGSCHFNGVTHSTQHRASGGGW
jgi:hypothetical protein